MNIEVRNIILDLNSRFVGSHHVQFCSIFNSRRVPPLFCRSTTIRCKVCTCFSSTLLSPYLFSIISTASKSKRTLRKLGVRSGTDPGMNNISVFNYLNCIQKQANTTETRCQICNRRRKILSPLTGIEPGFPACQANTLPRRCKSRLVPQGSTSVL